MITTHVLDTARGTPAARIPVQLDLFIHGQGWHEVGHAITSEDGRVLDFGEPPADGIYRMMFDVASYAPHSFFPSIAVTFEIRNDQLHHHVPLILSPFGYSVFLG